MREAYKFYLFVIHMNKKKKIYLSIEVQESFRAVNVMKVGETCDPTINAHWMNPQRAFGSHEDPVRVRAAYKHLQPMQTYIH